MKPYRCHCCSADFSSVKPQDPQRDLGYGTCPRCRDTVAKSWAKYGFAGSVLTLEDAYKRLDRYS